MSADKVNKPNDCFPSFLVSLLIRLKTYRQSDFLKSTEHSLCEISEVSLILDAYANTMENDAPLREGYG